MGLPVRFLQLQAMPVGRSSSVTVRTMTAEDARHRASSWLCSEIASMGTETQAARPERPEIDADGAPLREQMGIGL